MRELVDDHDATLIEWQDPPRSTQRFARGSIPPRELSVSFAPRKPITLQMAVPPMPEPARLVALPDPTLRAQRSSDLVDVAPPRRKRWPLLATAAAISLALGACSAYAFYGHRPARELDASALRVAVPALAPPVYGPRVAEQQARDAVAAQLADVDRAIAAERRSGNAVHALRDQLEARRRELAGVKKLASELEAARDTPPPDPFSRSTRSEDPHAAMLAQRHAELARRASQLSAQVRALESQLVGQAQAGTELAVDRLAARRAELVASLEGHERALHAPAAPPVPVAQVAFDQLPATGTRVFACELACRDVGEVSAVRDGEIDFDHPFRGRVRGRLVELRLSSPVGDVLFLGAAPF